MKKKKLQYRALLITCILIALMVLITSPGKKVRKYSYKGTLFTSQVKVDICYEKPQKEKLKPAVKEIWKRWEDIHFRMNMQDNHSDVSKVNNSYLSPVKIGEDTYLVMQEAMRFNQLTSGAFDITVFPLAELWQESTRKNEFPSPQDLAKAKKAVGPRKIRLLPDYKVKIMNKGTKVDFSGMAAGYAADEAVRILRRHGFENFLVDTGGVLYAGGLNCEGEPWRVTLKDPFEPAKIVDILQLSDLAVSTSGDNQQFYEAQGQKFMHLLDPATGYPIKWAVSATVIAPTAMEAAALATSLGILEGERGRQLIDRFGNGWGSILISHLDDQVNYFPSKNYALYKSLPNL